MSPLQITQKVFTISERILPAQAADEKHPCGVSLRNHTCWELEIVRIKNTMPELKGQRDDMLNFKGDLHIHT